MDLKTILIVSLWLFAMIRVSSPSDFKQNKDFQVGVLNNYPGTNNKIIILNRKFLEKL